LFLCKESHQSIKKKKKEKRSARRKLDNECIVVETEKTGRRSRDATLPATEGWAHL
jgi:hypothetical protein